MKHLLVLALLGAACSADAATFKIDSAHSSIEFTVRHFVSKVTGRFKTFSGSFEHVEGRPSAWSASAEIDPASVDTGVAKRDAHLRNPDFFDVERCPKMGFKSTKVEDVEGKIKMHGELTLHCVTKPVVLDLEFNGIMEDPWGNQRAGASASGTLNRKDWDVDYNMPLKTGGLMLGEDILFKIEIAGIAEAAPAKAKPAQK